MKKSIVYIILSIFWISPVLQAQDTLKKIELGELVISANKFEESKKDVAQQIHSLDARKIQFLNTQTVPDMLAQTGMVMVQRSQAGGGSPILRGFEASRVLLVIDGVRMNNLIYRTGHLQNAMSVDQNILDRAEVLFGPASTVYGSDALGGVIHFQTKTPRLVAANAPSGAGGTEGVQKREFGGNALMRYSSVNAEKTVHADISIAGLRFGSLSSFTFSDFGDLRMGKRPQALDTVWGLRHYYQARVNGRDTALPNDDPYRQVESGYTQYDAVQKFLYRPNDKVRMVANFQYSTSSDLPRYDRLTDPNSTTRLNQAEWYYGPQNRLMGAYELAINDLGFFDKMRLNANYQDITESRHTRGWQSSNRTSRFERVKVWGTSLDFARRKTRYDFYTGIEGQYSTVKSTASALNIRTNTVAAASTRYPDGANSQTTLAAYWSHTWRLTEGLVLTDGARLSYVGLRSTFVSQQFFKFPFSDVKQDNFGWSGNLGLIWSPTKFWRTTLMGSTGFRAPNVDDVAKVFDTNSRDRLVIVPNPDLKPEKTYNLDVNQTFTLLDGRMTWENVLFFTRFADAIALGNFSFNGQDSLDYDGVRSRVKANVNAEKARLWGISSVLKAQITEGGAESETGKVSVMASYNYTVGRLTQGDRKEVPLDHIAPVFGSVSLKYERLKGQTEVGVNFNNWKRRAQYRLGAEDNEQYATKEGMPAWWTLNWKASLDLTKNVKVQVGVENILDVNYRVFGSGIQAAGRNVFVALRGSI